MLAVDRRHRILERVAEQQTIHISDLAQEFGVSEMTVRRDVGRLERDGFLRRTYGGATARVTKSLELAFNARALQNAALKRVIGMAAARLLEATTTMFIGIGTTTEQMALFLPPRDDRMVITSSLPVASLLGTRRGRVVVLGGTIRRDELSCIGPIAAATVQHYHPQVAVLGAAGISARFGMTELDDEAAEINRLMIENSDALVVLADGSKFGTAAVATVERTQAIRTLVTDASAPEEEVAALRAEGVEVMIAQAGIGGTQLSGAADDGPSLHSVPTDGGTS
jgi:DeoR family transcriptional regulator, fructose operon transcriptional repressor